jgi:hypothetical protein
MDWAEETSNDLPPLPIDFDSKERSSSSSIHCAANAMVDDSDDVVVVSSFRDPDSGALALTPTPEPTPTPANPPSEVAQLFNLIMDTIRPIQVELKRIGDKVDGRSAPPLAAPVPATSTKTASARVTPARTSPPATRPTPTTPPPTQRVDDEVLESGAGLGGDVDFPSLSSSSNRKARYWHKAAADCEARNALVPGAPAPVQRNPTSGYVRTPPIFASVLTKAAMGAHASATDKAQTARTIQKRNPSGKLKPGHLIALLGFTEVVVTRNGGLDDLEAEEAFCRKAPVDIVQAAQRALYKASRNPPLILRGRWTENVARTGNFVYRLAGDIPLPTLLACRDQLCDPSRRVTSGLSPPKVGLGSNSGGLTFPTSMTMWTMSMREINYSRPSQLTPASRARTSWCRPTSRATPPSLASALLQSSRPSQTWITCTASGPRRRAYVCSEGRSNSSGRVTAPR